MEGGYLLSTSENTDVFPNYKNEAHEGRMHLGLNYELDYDYSFHKNFSFGAVFSMFNVFDSYYPQSAQIQQTYSDDRYLFYVAPSFMAQTDPIKEHWTLFARASIGYMNFRNAERNTISVTYKRPTLGYSLHAGADYSFNKYFSLTGAVSFFGASISNVNAPDDTEIELAETESLSRINLSLGVKIKL